MSNIKKEILLPPVGTFRTIFLYVGQGEATLMIIPDENSRQYVLIDSNFDKERNSINIKELTSSLADAEVIFINTHPHNDHVRGVADIKEKIKEVWHSGHVPSKKYGESFKELEDVIKKVGDKNVYYLRGSRDFNTLHTDREETSKVVRKIGEVDYRIFSPAKYVCEDIDGEDPEARRKRIHEQCGVFKFIYKNKSILLTGDSNKTAWKDYIVNYYKDALKSNVLSGAHHGSRTFFKENEEDEEVYEEHMKKIAPEYLVISAPKQNDSPHDHPHNDAMEIYKKYVKEENIFHLGKSERCIQVDINSTGDMDIREIDNVSDKDGVENSPLANLINNEFIPAVKGGGWSSL